MKKYYSICFLCVLLTGCKSTSFLQKEQNTTQHIILGNIGLNKDFLLENNYSNTAIPNYKSPIKLMATIKSFNKKTYSAFRKAQKHQMAKVSVKYIDSLKDKPHYVSLKIMDKVDLIETINNKSNHAVKGYLSTQSDAAIVTQVAIALTEEDRNVIIKADACFLVEYANKSYGIHLYENGEPYKLIKFSSGVVFNYKVSNACWKANSKYHIEISDLVNQKTDCPNGTYSSASRAKNKINYFKL